MTQLQRPFVYIAALMRTGSTLLSEALTRLPYAFIFREPHIGKNDFQPKSGDIELLSQYDVDLEWFLRFRLLCAFLQRRLRRFGFRQDYMVRVLKYKLMPAVNEIKQFGVKEIRNTGWQNYARHFPDMKVIVTARDPRDIYISTYYRGKRNLMRRYVSITPDLIAAELNAEFKLQRRILEETTDYFLVRYEDLCTVPRLLADILAFVESPIPTQGNIGQFNKRHPGRGNEYRLHGNAITDQRVHRWKREPNRELVDEAKQLFERMPEYTEFWDYKL